MIVEALIVLALGLSVQARECDSNEDKIYYLSDKGASLPWTAALAECNRRGMTLATVRNQQEFEQFIQVVSTSESTSNILMGASCEDECAAGNRSAWYWITDGSKVQSSHPASDYWTDFEPDDYKGEERVMSSRIDQSWRWGDGPYKDHHPWICQLCKPKCAQASICPS